MNLTEAEQKIKEHVESPASFSHNIVSLILNQIKKEYGESVANGLIDKHNIEYHFGINKTVVDSEV